MVGRAMHEQGIREGGKIGCMEELLAYGLVWDRGLSDGAAYRAALDKLYGDSESTTGLLLELETVADDSRSTLRMLEEWRLSNEDEFSVGKFGRALMESLEEAYRSKRYSKEELGKGAYSIWCWLPMEIAAELPFYELCNIDEYLTSPAHPEGLADEVFEEMFLFYKARQ